MNKKNELTRNQQRKIVEWFVIACFMVLIVTLSFLALQSDYDQLEATNNALKQENTSLMQEIQKQDAEIETLKWQLEQEQSKK